MLGLSIKQSFWNKLVLPLLLAALILGSLLPISILWYNTEIEGQLKGWKTSVISKTGSQLLLQGQAYEVLDLVENSGLSDSRTPICITDDRGRRILVGQASSKSPYEESLCDISSRGREVITLATTEGITEGHVIFSPSTPVLVRTRLLLSLLAVTVFAVAGFLVLVLYRSRFATSHVTDLISRGIENAIIGEVPRLPEELKHLESRIKESRDRIFSLNQKVLAMQVHAELGNDVAQIAHDLGSPIAALQTVRDSAPKLSDEEKMILTMAVARLKGLKGSLLDKYRSERKRPIGTILNEVILEKTFVNRSKKISFRRNLENDVDSTVLRIDENALARIISNLVNNSIEAIDQKGSKQGEIILTVDWLDSSNSHLCISVSDNGPGIPQSILENLGQENISSKNQKGFGLGLTGAKKAMCAVGGDLKIFSSPERGTEVHLVVPVT